MALNSGSLPLPPMQKFIPLDMGVVIQQQECLTPIPNPDAQYQAATTKIDISAIPDFTSVNSITDGVQTVTLAVPAEKRTVPDSWSTWSSPPQSESATPSVLFTATSNSNILTLSVPASTFGFELEPNDLGTHTFTVEFFSGNILVGSITRDVTGNSGALLFAGTTCGPCIDRVVITGPDAAGGFAIAQVRYTVCATRGVQLSEVDIEL